MKILLIEDDGQMGCHISQALRAQSHEVEESDNGSDGAVRSRWLIASEA